jgi:hypothetical protein
MQYILDDDVDHLLIDHPNGAIAPLQSIAVITSSHVTRQHHLNTIEWCHIHTRLDAPDRSPYRIIVCHDDAIRSLRMPNARAIPAITFGPAV